MKLPMKDAEITVLQMKVFIYPQNSYVTGEAAPTGEVFALALD